MDAKIFLQSHLSKKSSNTSNGVNVQFKGRRKLLPTNDVSEIVSQYDQYLLERESCNKIRLTCQVNPICTNVLFNPITEIVRYEGSNNVELLNYLDGSTELKNTDLRNCNVYMTLNEMPLGTHNCPIPRMDLYIIAVLIY